MLLLGNEKHARNNVTVEYIGTHTARSDDILNIWICGLVVFEGSK